MDEKESYDPVVEAKKIEEAIMKNVVRAENAVKLARECGVMAKLRAAKSVLPTFLQRGDVQDYLKLSKDSLEIGVKTYRDLVAVALAIDGILETYGDAFDDEKRADLASISLIITEVVKSLGKRPLLPWTRYIADEDYIFFANYVIRNIIEGGFAHKDKVPVVEKAFLSSFPGLEKILPKTRLLATNLKARL